MRSIPAPSLFSRDLTPASMRALLVSILAVAAALRIAAALIFPDQSASLPDALAYRSAANNLLETGRLQMPYWMPLYPLLVAAAGSPAAQLAADIALSVAIVGIVFRLSLAMFCDRTAAALAAAIAAVYPPLVFFAIVGLSETLFIALALAAFMFWYERKFTFAAVSAVLAILTRPTFEPIAIAMVPFFSIVVHRQTFKMTARHIGSFALVYVLLLTPWWLHNYREYGQFVRLTPTAGLVLFIGHNPKNVSGGGNQGEDYDTSAFDGIANVVERDRALMQAAVGYIVADPWRAVEGAGRKFVRMWQPWPRHSDYRSWTAVILQSLTYLPVLILALIYLAMRLRREWRVLGPIALTIGLYTAIHMIMVGTIRYRLPMEPLLIVLAAAAVARIFLPARAAPDLSPAADAQLSQPAQTREAAIGNELARKINLSN